VRTLPGVRCCLHASVAASQSKPTDAKTLARLQALLRHDVLSSGPDVYESISSLQRMTGVVPNYSHFLSLSLARFPFECVSLGLPLLPRSRPRAAI
jgi:hypothetical protein